MRGKISEWLLVSDVDGTLLDRGYRLPEKNIEAIGRFVRKGGRFTLATGRPPFHSKPYIDMLPVNAPAIIMNGACIFDFERNEPVFSQFLSKNASRYLGEIMEKFPHVAAVVMSGENGYNVGDTGAAEKYCKASSSYAQRRTLGELSGDFQKVLFAADPSEIDKLEAFLENGAYKDVSFVRSEDIFYEMLPLGQTKGTALMRLAAHLGIPAHRTAAIGDYYNDIELLKAAGIGAAVENAPDAVKDAADIVVCHCGDGAVAAFIEYLEEQFDY